MDIQIVLVLLLGTNIDTTKCGQGFYNIAHMTNNIYAVDWAIRNGANAVEIDLQFQEDGTPYAFFHAPTCDCTCLCPLIGSCKGLFPGSVCVELQKTSSKPCIARTDAKQLLNHIASKRRDIELVMFDSKLTDDDKKMSALTQRMAAQKLMKLIMNELIGKGYVAEIVIGAPYFHSFTYIEEVAKLAAQQPLTKDIIHFTVDMEPALETKKRLDFLYNKNIVYNVGISACAPVSSASAEKSKLAAINKAKGLFGMTYTWTVDKKSSLEYYARYFTGIITNYPATLAEVLKEQGIKLASYKDRIPPSVSGMLETNAKPYSCRCRYVNGGCKIVEAAPRGLACRCKHSFIRTCWGARVVLCSDIDHPKCKTPDASKEACLLGRGNCVGYF